MGTVTDSTRLFIVAQDDDAAALAALAQDDGWAPVVDTGGRELVARALASGAAVILVDGRKAPAAGLAAVRALGGLIAATGAALLVLTDDGDTLDKLYTAGATHFLRETGDPADIQLALRFAARHATRHQGERRGPAFGLRADPEDVSEPISAWLEAGRQVGIVRIALSRLDILNAARGRAVGDALIAEAHRQVRTMAAELLGDDAVVGAPRGGDIVVAAVAEPGALIGLARALDGALSRPIAVGGRQAVLGSRWSLAESAPGDDAASLLHRAAEALVSAKASDGPTIRVAGPEHTAPIDSLAIDLHFAIERDEIDILFQPQARIDSRRVTGVEALARWRHGRLGPLGADVLFAAAERADLGLVLSDHIQGLVLARIAAWPESLSHVRVALNITAGDLGRPGFAYSFLRRVGASGVACDRLTVEVTESGAIHNLDRAAAILTDLRAAGLRVALDDFGTGYSSLAYLTTLPLDYLKLDKALALGIERTRRHRGVVRAVMTLARSLGLAVVAEGIETDTQRQLLAAEGCAFYQGFLLAPALDDAALAAMVGDGTC